MDDFLSFPASKHRRILTKTRKKGLTIPSQVLKPLPTQGMLAPIAMAPGPAVAPKEKELPHSSLEDAAPGTGTLPAQQPQEVSSGDKKQSPNEGSDVCHLSGEEWRPHQLLKKQEANHGHKHADATSQKRGGAQVPRRP